MISNQVQKERQGTGKPRSKLSAEKIEQVLVDNSSCYYEFLGHTGGSCMTDVCLDCAKKLVSTKEFLHDPNQPEDGPRFYGVDENIWERRFHCYLCHTRIPTIRRDSSLIENLLSFWEFQWKEIKLFPLILKEEGLLPALRALFWIAPSKKNGNKEDPNHIGEIL